MTEIVTVQDGASYEELRAAQDKINAELSKVAASARTEGVAKVVALIREFDITPEELNKALSAKTPKTKSTKAKKVSTGVKAAPKYRDPATGSTWTGRGVAPAWIKDVAKEDRTRFLIVSEAPAAAPTAEAPAAIEPETEASVAEVTKPLFNG